MKIIITTVLMLSLLPIEHGNYIDRVIGQFNTEQDLLLGHFDCKTDVDDLHSVAAFATLMNYPDYEDVNYHAVAGAYGTQGGLYVPPNSLFKMAFGENWSDAHEDFEKAVENVKILAMQALTKGGDIFIADAGQSDFSAALVKAIVKEVPDIVTKDRIHVVQHSNWNEEVTSTEALNYVKTHTDYQKIPDGNAVNNGSPGFRSEEAIKWRSFIDDKDLIRVWEQAIALANQYNGKENRYLNEAIASGGLDFSDLSETCWIFGLQDIKDANEFFRYIQQ